MPTLADAIHEACSLQREAGCKRSHRWRMKAHAAILAERALRARIRLIQTASSFHALLAVVENIFVQVAGAGELYSYDTALGLGAKLNLLPDEVYLHCGTRDGARALSFDGERASIPVREFDPPLRVLSPFEIEDVLCIYKNKLGQAKTEYRKRK